jgi:membrane dipeptidase
MLLRHVTDGGVVDHRANPQAWARTLDISREAVDLYLASDVIDLHIDSFIWTRVLGYRIDRRHGHGLLGARLYSQVDLPRLREARVSGAGWSITTNPLPRRGHPARYAANRRALLDAFARAGDVSVCRGVADYRAARAADRHAAFVSVQGGDAVADDGALEAAAAGGELVRVTLVHLRNTALGATSAPFDLRRAFGAAARPGKPGLAAPRSDGHLTARGRDFVRRLDAARVFVDLAHIHPRGFFDAVDAHDRSLPLMVSHTGVTGVTPHWRNIDDDQLRAVAATGGVVGVMYQSSFLGDPLLHGRATSIVDHLQHVVDTVGDDHAALGSDWDGAIVPPRDLPTCLELPRLVQLMLDRGWSAARVQKVLGGNFLRALGALRP